MLSLQTRCDIYIINDKTVHKKNLTDKFIMELSKLKHLQLRMNYFSNELWKIWTQSTNTLTINWSWNRNGTINWNTWNRTHWNDHKNISQHSGTNFQQRIWKKIPPSEWSKHVLPHPETFRVSASIQTLPPIKKMLTSKNKREIPMLWI